MPVKPASSNAHLLIDDEPVGVRRLARVVALEIAHELRRQGVIVIEPGIRSRRRREMTEWRDRNTQLDTESTDRTNIEDDGESSLWMQMADETIDTLNRKKMRSSSSGRSRRSSKS
jgi:hypothetical protein